MTDYFNKYAHIFHICNYDIYYTDQYFKRDFLSNETSLQFFTLENVTELLFQFDNYVNEIYNKKCIKNQDLNSYFGQIQEVTFTQSVINDERFNQFIKDSLELLLPYNSMESIEHLEEFLSEHSRSKKIAKSLQFIGQDKLNQIISLGDVILSRLDESSVFVDLGGGKGHLSRYIASASKLKADDIFVIERDEKLIGQGKRLNGEINFVNMLINDSTISLDAIVGEISTFCGKTSLLDRKLVIAAIHTCGNFGVGLIKMLARTQAKVLMIQAPCCYHFIQQDYFLISTIFSSLKGSLLENDSFNLRSFLNIACVDYWKSVGHCEESILKEKELRNLSCRQYNNSDQIKLKLYESQKKRISDLFQKVAKQKHRRLIYEKVNQVLRKIMGHDHKPKRSRVNPESENSLFSYFKQQIDTQLLYYKDDLLRQQELDDFCQQIVCNLKTYEETKAVKPLQNIISQIFDIKHVQHLEDDVRYSYNTKTRLLYFIHIIQIIACRVLERLVVTDRQQYLLEAGIQCNVSLFCHALLTPRNFLLVCEK